MASKLDVAIRVLVEGSRNLQGVDRDMQKVGASADSIKGKLKSAFSPTNLAIGGITAGIGLVTAGLVGAVTSLLELERLNAQTAAAIESTGGAAKVSAKHIGDYADNLEKSTGIQRETIQEGQNLLLTFTNIRNEVGAGNDVFDQATAAMNDMSVALRQDVKSSAIQLGKALNDPIKGITALSRVGVTFTAQQKNLIRSLVETGDTLGAQKVILEELNKEFGGSAEAFGETTSGKIARFGNEVGETFESIILGGLKVTDALGNLAQATADDFDAIGDFLSTEITFDGIVDAARSVVGDVDKELSGMPSSAQIQALAAVRAVEEEYEKGGPVISKEAGKIAGMLPSEIRAKVADIRAAGRENVVQFAAGMLDAQQDPQTAIDALVLAQKETLTRSAEITRLQGQLASENLAAGLNDGREGVRLAAEAARAVIIDRLSTLGAYEWGLNVTGTFAAGMEAGLVRVRQAAVGVASATGAAIRIESEPPDHSSPLYGITKWGGNIVQTIADGIYSQLSVGRAAASALATALAPGTVGSNVGALASAGRSAGSASLTGGSVTNLTIVLQNHGDPILDEKDIVETLQLLTPFITGQKAALARG